MSSMGYYEKEYRSRMHISKDGNPLFMLIAINLVVFVLFSFIKVVYYFNDSIELYQQQVLNWFTLPADAGKLFLRPWTLVTHFLLHDGLWHAIGNMIWLWVFGYILQDLSGKRRVVPVFVYGALAGALFFILSYNFLTVLKPELPYAHALGASAGVMAVAVATTMIAPGYRIFPMIMGGIPLWVLTALFVVMDLATIPYNNPGGHIAHIAGAGMGAFFVFMLRKDYDLGGWMNDFFDWTNNLFNPNKPKKGQRLKDQLFYRSTTKPFKKTLNLTQQKVDEILDKINQKGYSYLSEEEKELLKRASKEDML
jgi:membrane associated rhomboid family serine protease